MDSILSVSEIVYLLEEMFKVAGEQTWYLVLKEVAVVILELTILLDEFNKNK